MPQGWTGFKGEPHHLVFVPVVGKPQILSQGLVEYPQRVRKQDASVNRELALAPPAPGSTGEVAKSIHRDCDRLRKGRGPVGRGQVRQMMLNPMHFPREGFPGKHFFKLLLNPLPLFAVADSIENQLQV